jgi:hypothetical protein
MAPWWAERSPPSGWRRAAPLLVAQLDDDHRDVVVAAGVQGRAHQGVGELGGVVGLEDGRELVVVQG